MALTVYGGNLAHLALSRVPKVWQLRGVMRLSSSFSREEDLVGKPFDVLGGGRSVRS